MVPSTRVGYSYAAASALTGAIMVTASKLVLGTLSPIGLASLVFPLATLVLSVWLHVEIGWAPLRSIRGINLAWIAGVTGFYIAATWGFWAALALLEPSVHALLNRMQVVPAVLLGVWLLGERFGRREVMGGVLLLFGIVLIRRTGGVGMDRGFMLLAMSSCCYAVSEVVAKRAVAFVDPIALTWGRNALASLTFATIAVASGTMPSIVQPLPVWLGLGLVAASGPVLSRVFYYRALQHLEVSKATLVGQTQPLWVSLLAIGFMGDRLTWAEWVGAAIILAGCALLVWRWSLPEMVERASASRDYAVRQWKHYVVKRR
jgi:drug/metabolite transporter (DMT)-like permease